MTCVSNFQQDLKFMRRLSFSPQVMINTFESPTKLQDLGALQLSPLTAPSTINGYPDPLLFDFFRNE